MTSAMSIIEERNASRIIQRRFAVLMLYGLSALWGIAQAVAPDNPLLPIMNTLAFATFSTLWFTIDRRILAKPRLSVLELLFFISWPVASMIHLLTSRGFRGIGYWLLHAFGLFLTMSLTYSLVVFLLYSVGVLDLQALS